MDDAGPAIALSAVRHLRDRQRAGDETRWGALVSAVAVRTLARRQCGVTLRCVASFEMVQLRGNLKLPHGLARCLLHGDIIDAPEIPTERPRPPADRFVGSCRDPARHYCGRPLSDPAFQSPPNQQLC